MKELKLQRTQVYASRRFWCYCFQDLTPNKEMSRTRGERVQASGLPLLWVRGRAGEPPQGTQATLIAARQCSFSVCGWLITNF